MKQSDHFQGNAQNCAQLAERATDEQDWLDSEAAKTPSRLTRPAV